MASVTGARSAMGCNVDVPPGRPAAAARASGCPLEACPAGGAVTTPPSATVPASTSFSCRM